MAYSATVLQTFLHGATIKGCVTEAWWGTTGFFFSSVHAVRCAALSCFHDLPPLFAQRKQFPVKQFISEFLLSSFSKMFTHCSLHFVPESCPCVKNALPQLYVCVCVASAHLRLSGAPCAGAQVQPLPSPVAVISELRGIISSPQLS